MKQLALVSFVMLAVAGMAMAQTTAPQTSSSFEVKVQATVVPNIAVGGPSNFQDIGSVAAGDQGSITALIPFRVHANTESVILSVGATGLYKGGDPTTLDIIPVDQSKNAIIVTSLAAQKDKPDNSLPWTGGPFLAHGLLGVMTTTGIFEAGTQGTFSIDFQVQVSWVNTNPELSVGTYTGYVTLFAQINP